MPSLNLASETILHTEKLLVCHKRHRSRCFCCTTCASYSSTEVFSPAVPPAPWRGIRKTAKPIYVQSIGRFFSMIGMSVPARCRRCSRSKDRLWLCFRLNCQVKSKKERKKKGKPKESGIFFFVLSLKGKNQRNFIRRRVRLSR